MNQFITIDQLIIFGFVCTIMIILTSIVEQNWWGVAGGVILLGAWGLIHYFEKTGRSIRKK